MLIDNNISFFDLLSVAVSEFVVFWCDFSQHVFYNLREVPCAAGIFCKHAGTSGNDSV